MEEMTIKCLGKEESDKVYKNAVKSQVETIYNVPDYQGLKTYKIGGFSYSSCLAIRTDLDPTVYGDQRVFIANQVSIGLTTFDNRSGQNEEFYSESLHSLYKIVKTRFKMLETNPLLLDEYICVVTTKGVASLYSFNENKELFSKFCSYIDVIYPSFADKLEMDRFFPSNTKIDIIVDKFVQKQEVITKELKTLSSQDINNLILLQNQIRDLKIKFIGPFPTSSAGVEKKEMIKRMLVDAEYNLGVIEYHYGLRPFAPNQGDEHYLKTFDSLLENLDKVRIE
jgi:hypothetical protein